jgi:hypothetical protein
VPSFVVELLGLYVRVHQEIPRTVVFIGTDAGGAFIPVGTAFLGAYRYKDLHFPMLVTADHVLDLIKSDYISVRINRKGMEAAVIHVHKSLKFSDYRNDIAVIPLGLPSGTDHLYVHLNREDFEERKKTLAAPDIGDEVATVGLYASHHGYTKNVPVVRIGNIARMPDDERVRSTRGECSAYLIETRSIMGLSGSPVFLNVAPIKVDEGGELRFLSGGNNHFPIGMMLGYHLVRSAEDQIAVPHSDDYEPGPDTDERNTGFAVVIPFEKILEVVESDVMKEDMDRSAAKHFSQVKVRPAGAAPSTPDEQEIAKRRDEALARALNTPPKPKTKPDSV